VAFFLFERKEEIAALIGFIQTRKGDSQPLPGIPAASRSKTTLK
jgi:hypothetical protein